MSDAMRVGVIGSGYWARTIHGASAASHPNVELVGVWGRDRGRTEGTAAELGTRPYNNLDALIGDVDALTFAVPPDVQAEIGLKAARAGRHLLLEKPVATSVKDGRALEQAVSESNVASLVFFTRRFLPENERWLEHLAQVGGWECGRAEFAASIFVEGNPFSGSLWRKEKGGLWDIGPHALSMLIPALGEVESVLCGGGARDQVHLAMRHAGGGSSTASLSLMVPVAAIGNALYVYGEHGREDAPPGPFDPLLAHQAALDSLIEQAAAPTKGHRCDVHFGVRVVEVLAAAETSLSTGRLVKI